MNQQTRTSAPNNLAGLLIAVVNTVVISSLGATGKYVAGQISIYVVALVFSLAGFLVVLPWALAKGRRGDLRTRALGFQLLRALTTAVALVAWLWALPQVQLADMSALSFTSILFVLLGAILFLGEPSQPWRWAALGCGLLGMLIILRPGVGEFSMGLLVLVFASACMGVARLTTKVIVRHDSMTVLMVWQAGLLVVLVAPAALLDWQWPNLAQFIWLVGFGILGIVQQFLMVWAIRLADFGVIEPVSFLKLVWSAGLGFVIFGDIPTWSTVLGGSVLVLTILYIARRERAEGRAEGRAESRASTGLVE